MSEERGILQQIVDNFSVERFARFFRAKSPDFIPLNSTTASPVEPKDTEHFKNTQAIGKLPCGDANMVLICALEVQGDLTARSSKRRQYEEARHILRMAQHSEYTAGIFVFYDGTRVGKRARFRFSLVWNDVNEQSRRREWSNFRRFTYFVEGDGPYATFLKQIGDGDFSSFAKIKDAFAVEPITTEFYQKIERWYHWAITKTRFPQSGEANQRIAVIRLITRIIFLWFMRQRGLIPAELFTAEFAQTTLKDSAPDSISYYRAVLQNLFFATLNTPQEERNFRNENSYQGHNKDFGNQHVFRFMDLMKQSANFIGRLQRIPFLNGGLFECLDQTKEKPYVYKDGFTERGDKYQAHVPQELFFDKEHGLLEMLSQYNFTIDENSSRDQEVALDPELLGRVFENLLAFTNPDNLGDKDESKSLRKESGTFYTPRGIVEYMARAALCAYFHKRLQQPPPDFDNAFHELFADGSLDHSDAANTEPSLLHNAEQMREMVDLIDSLRIVDPAVGSGAFPMGILALLVQLLTKLDPDNELWKQKQLDRTNGIPDSKAREEAQKAIERYFAEGDSDYGRKLYLIQHCLYGVDSDPVAIEIAKLRFFLSLLVDAQIQENEDNYGLEPLPNLRFKLIRADSLRAFPSDVLSDNQLYRQLEQDKETHFYESDDKKKKKLEGRIGDNFTALIAGISTMHEEYAAVKFDFRMHFSEVFRQQAGFDIVIANPPYIPLQRDGSKLSEFYQKYGYSTLDRNGDIYGLFYERGLNIARPNGHLCYITSNKWMRSGYGKKLRAFFLQHTPLQLIDLGPGVFEHAAVDSAVLLIRRAPANSEAAQEADDVARAFDLSQRSSHHLTADEIAEQAKDNGVAWTKPNNGEGWFIGSQAEVELKEKIERIGKPLKEWAVEIRRGVITGCKDAFVIDAQTRERLLEECADSAERKRTTAIINPMLSGQDIKRYHAQWAGLYIIVIPSGWTNANRGAIDAETFFESVYPQIRKHLMSTPPSVRGKGLYQRADQGDYWWELRPCKYYSEFEKEKIVQPQTAKKQSFTIDTQGLYGNVTMQFWISKNNDIKYILGLANSKIFNFYMRRTAYAYGKEGTRWIPAFLFNVPIPSITDQNRTAVAKIERLTDDILTAKAASKSLLTRGGKGGLADTSALEQQIDRLVYELYDLTPTEIAIIENTAQ